MAKEKTSKQVEQVNTRTHALMRREEKEEQAKAEQKKTEE